MATGRYNLLRVIFVLLSFIGLFYVVVFVKSISSRDLNVGNLRDPNDMLPRYYADSTDSSMFNRELIQKVKFNSVWVNKVREPIIFSLYNNEYYLLVHRIIADSILGKKIFSLTEENSELPEFKSYRFATLEIFDFNWSRQKIDTISQVRIKYTGDSIRTKFVSDSLLRLELSCRNLSIDFGSERPVDIYLEGKNNLWTKHSKFPLDILIARNGNVLDFYFMVPESNGVQLGKGLIDKVAQKDRHNN